MAARLTDRQKKKIVADYLESGSYRATGRKNNVCAETVKRIVAECGDIEQKVARKKAENTADILAYMESQRGIVCQIIGKGLTVLNDPEKLKEATPAQITTALGTLIDKFTRQMPTQHVELQAQMSLEDKLRLIREAAMEYGDDG